MKAQYKNRPPQTELHGVKMLINFNIEEKTKEGQQGTETYFECDQVFVSENPSRPEVIEAVIGSRYSTGAELATINNKDEKPTEYEAYQVFRLFAKELATEIAE